MKSIFIEHLTKKYPSLLKSDLEKLISGNLLSPFQIELSSQTLEKIEAIIQAFYEMRSSSKYQELLRPEIGDAQLTDPGNKGILMSYDFHLDNENQPKLIEINTNASFLALGFEFYQARNLKLPRPDFALSELKENILEEIQLFRKKSARPTSNPLKEEGLRIAIVDENPEEQRLYVEFLLYQEIFKSWGWEAKILNVKDLETFNNPFDFIYNRHTDFYLKHQVSQSLQRIFRGHQCCISPHPLEYFLLADKERYSNWSDSLFMKNLGLRDSSRQIIENALLPSFRLNTQSAERAWNERKRLFFKPLHSFGSKQAYKGASISRNIFESAVKSRDFLAQTYIPAPEKSFTLPDGSSLNMKYDLRCYAYQGRLQFAVARLYQGQVTNLRVLGGGFAPLIIF